MDVITKSAAPAGGDVGEVAATSLPRFKPACSVTEWLQGAARRKDTADLLGELNRRLVEVGIPIARTGVVLRTLHPQYVAGAYMWNDDTREVEVREAGHEMLSNDLYLQSPIKAINDGSPGIRRRLIDPHCPDDFPILTDLREQGMTDYLALPLEFSDGRHYAASWATRSPTGFSDDHIERLVALMPPLAMALEVRSMQRIARTLMDTYVGPQAGARVLNGAIHRGTTEIIDAVIWYSDLRGFTRMTEGLGSEAVLALLNEHFEQLAGPISDNGGEILKFMGDAVLAIFPLDERGDARAATRGALLAAKEAKVRTKAVNETRREEGLPEIAYDMALHLGEVVYGNIGASNRLDFTVIGPAVNQAARMEGYCRTLDRGLVVSAAFAEAADKGLISLGFHALRGVPEPLELFTKEGFNL